MSSDGIDPLHAGGVPTDTLGGLGRLVETFRPSWPRLVVGAAFGLVLLGVGLQATVRYALGWGDTSRAANPALERWGIVVIGLVGALGGVGLLAYVRAMGSSQVWLFESGVAGVRRGHVSAFPWGDIAEICEGETAVRLIRGPRALVPTATSSMYAIIRRDGVVFAFDADRIWAADRLAGMLRDECMRRGIPWRVSTTTV